MDGSWPLLCTPYAVQTKPIWSFLRSKRIEGEKGSVESSIMPAVQTFSAKVFAALSCSSIHVTKRRMHFGPPLALDPSEALGRILEGSG